jgi:hypothetical protein
MMQRCYNQNADNYPRYGGVGIKVCRRWHAFENFYADMGERPSHHSLDRKQSNRNYSPANCRWATRREQQENKGLTVYATIDGVRKTLGQWAKDSGFSYFTLHKRLRMGWPEQMLLAPRGSTAGQKLRGKPKSAEHASRIGAALLEYHRKKREAECRL